MFSLLLGCATAAAAALVSPACLERRPEPSVNPDIARCTGCHGDPTRSSDALRCAAPPKDLLGATDPHYPGVGAHGIHLDASATHGAVACSECHVVPERVDSPGHLGPAPAPVTFGPLATTAGHDPTYDPKTRTCLDSYCHRDAWPVWSNPRSSADACGTCHGLPPPLPHPQSDRCSVCHGEVIDADRHFIAPERHVDGHLDYVAGDCVLCHGSKDNPAPPLDTHGNSDITALGVGAHQAHLMGSATSRALACDECHVVPAEIWDPAHIEGLPARVVLTGVAASMGRAPEWDHASATCGDTYCHSPSPGDERSSPLWNVAQTLACDGCHALPPPAPHPVYDDCSVCHGAVLEPDNRTFSAPSEHVDGVVDVSLDALTCTSCHGSAQNPAPPRDAEGNTQTTAPGVGAHQTHVLGTARSRPVPCGECHRVPENVLDPGHIDTPRPAEVVFAGVALAQDAKPVYANGTCRATSCHGAVFPNGDPSGGSNTEPVWTRVDGTQAQCGSCHGIPPPPPHPNPYPCHLCHQDMAEDDTTFTHPELHVDGIVTFQVAQP
ncbi:MAG TPA: CxxxxCH/CxxCH domain-containing protein [Polyangiaceae bacterium]|nr:CxxxxCH/CxxCH domain-containing protein [Polyangiaceae bacterium]